MEVVAGETGVVETTVVGGVSVVVEATVVIGKSDVLVGVSVSEAPPQAEANRSKQTTSPTFFMPEVCHTACRHLMPGATKCFYYTKSSLRTSIRSSPADFMA